MYAVIHGSRECISLLLDRGADVNAANRYGSTALMWAGGDASIVKSLLDRGAAVDAQTTDGTTALLVAARYGNLESLRLLLEHGASGAISPNVREELLRIAYSDSDSTMLRMLERFGLKLTHGSELRGPVVSPNVTQPAVMRRFLTLGASPQETATTSTITLPALSYAAGQAAAPALVALLDHGADPNARGSRGLTPLMMAAAVDDTVEATELLLARGADVALRDEAGRTALDWALMRGETPIARVLRQAGAVPMAPPPAAPASVVEPRTARDAVARAVAKLQAAGPAFRERSNCISCHSHSLPAVAVRLARDQRHPGRSGTRRPTPQRQPSPIGPVSASETCSPASRLAEAGRPLSTIWHTVCSHWQPKRSLLRLSPMPSRCVLPRCRITTAVGTEERRHSLESGHRSMPLQFRRRHWPFAGYRCTLLLADGAKSPVASIALDRIWSGQRQSTLKGRRSSSSASCGRTLTPISSRIQRSRLLALQRHDGGWAQLPTMMSDAYATGQALYALRAGGLSPMTAAYQSGAHYLRRTQLDDGTWFVRSRGVGFLPYFDGGFPHGRDQFISAAATSWAVMALTPTIEARDDAEVLSSPRVRR